MVRETRYLIVRNLPENCTEQAVIDHFQRYGKIQSVKLQAAKENDSGGSTATVAFNDIKSAAKAHHAKNSLGEVTLRTDYWEGSTGTPVLTTPPPAQSGPSRGPTGSSTSASAPPSRPVASFSNWTKGKKEKNHSPPPPPSHPPLQCVSWSTMEYQVSSIVPTHCIHIFLTFPMSGLYLVFYSV